MGPLQTLALRMDRRVWAGLSRSQWAQYQRGQCAFAKMTTFVDVYSAAWVLLKGHRYSAIDVLQLSPGARVTHALCGVEWGLGGKLAESEELRKAFGPARYLVSGSIFVELRGCPASVRLLVPRHPTPCPQCQGLLFRKHCDVCDSALPFAPRPARCRRSQLRTLSGWNAASSC